MLSFLSSNDVLVSADFWTFTLKNGTTLNYTTWDTDVVISGTTYKSHDVILAGGKMKQTRGLEVNEVDLTCYPNLGSSPSTITPNNLNPAKIYGLLDYSGATISGLPFLQACVSGVLDRATAQRFKGFCLGPVSAGYPQNFGYYGLIRLFLGEITDVEVTRNTATLKMKDATNLLNIQMPRRQYQPTCTWTFGDSNCTFNRASLTVSSTVNTGSASTTINCGLTQQAGYFNFGTVTFTSGKNAGVTRMVKSYNTGVITLSGSFPQPLVVGDAFSITPGCSKNYAGGSSSFNGSANSGNTPNYVLSNLPMAAGYFNGGQLQFTSGVNVGQSRTVSWWANGEAYLTSPMPYTPALGDEFVITTSPSSSQNSCTTYSNTANFGGAPTIPVPETAY